MASKGPTIPTLPNSSWMRRAACRDEPADVLTPHEGEEEETLRLKANRNRLCNGHGVRPCPVIDACLAWALEANLRTGVAGGLTAIERDPMRRQQRRDA